MHIQLLAARRFSSWCARRTVLPLIVLTVALTACSVAGGHATPSPAEHGDLVLVDRDGVAHDLAGAASVLLFWQPWCAACREEAPQAVEASAEFSGRLRFFGVVSGPTGTVDERLVEQSIHDLGLGYPQIRDEDLALCRRFAVDSTPTVVVIDAAGHVRYRGNHLPTDWSVAN